MESMIELKAPLGAQLELTPLCNHNCTYCYNYWRPDKLPTTKDIKEKYTLDHFKKIVDVLAEAEIFDLTLTGGEPFLRKDIIFDLIPYIQNANIEANINTNATVLNRADAKKLKDCGINGLLTSFCSSDEALFTKITGNSSAYKTYVKNLEMLLKEGFVISSNMVVMQENKHLVYDTGKFVHEHGVRCFSATPMVPSKYHLNKSMILKNEDVTKMLFDLVRLKDEVGITIDVLEALPKCAIPEELRKKDYDFLNRACAAGRTTMSVSVEGDVRPCSHAHQNYGNILVDDFETIWERMREWRIDSYVPTRCKEACAEFKFCNGGCRINALNFSGNLDGKDQWMTAPVETSLERTLRPIEIDSHAQYEVVPGVKLRKEADDFYITYAGGLNKMIFANSEFISLLRLLANSKTFCPEDILLQQRFNQKSFIPILRYLYAKHFIKEVPKCLSH